MNDFEEAADREFRVNLAISCYAAKGCKGIHVVYSDGNPEELVRALYPGVQSYTYDQLEQEYCETGAVIDGFDQSLSWRWKELPILHKACVSELPLVVIFPTTVKEIPTDRHQCLSVTFRSSLLPEPGPAYQQRIATFNLISEWRLVREAVEKLYSLTARFSYLTDSVVWQIGEEYLVLRNKFNLSSDYTLRKLSPETSPIIQTRAVNAGN